MSNIFKPIAGKPAKNQMKQDMIVILDLGSHENTVLARAIRALGVYSEIYPRYHSRRTESIAQVKDNNHILLHLILVVFKLLYCYYSLSFFKRSANIKIFRETIMHWFSKVSEQSNVFLTTIVFQKELKQHSTRPDSNNLILPYNLLKSDEAGYDCYPWLG